MLFLNDRDKSEQYKYSELNELIYQEALHNLHDLSFPYVLIGNLVRNSRISTMNMWK